MHEVTILNFFWLKLFTTNSIIFKNLIFTIFEKDWKLIKPYDVILLVEDSME